MPTGAYTLDDIDQGTPAPKGKYSLTEVEQNHTNPSAMDYISESLAGIGRGVKGLLIDTPLYIGQAALRKPTPGKPLTYLGAGGNMAQDALTQLHAGYEARQQARQQGEGIPGQILATAEQYPIIGGIVKKAEEGGPGIFPTPQSLGAGLEGATYAVGPKALKEVPRVVSEALPSRVRASTAIQQVKAAIGDQPILAPTKSYAMAVDLADKLERQGKAIPSELKAYIGRVLGERGTGEPLTFNDLHEAREALNDLKYDKNVQGKTGRMSGAVAEQMGQELQQHAGRAGVDIGELWKAGQQEYARASALQRMADSKLANRVAGGLGAATAATLMPKGTPLHARYLAGAAGYGLTEPLIGSLVKSVVNRDAGPPKLSIPRTTEEYTRTILAAKEGTISPDEANRRIARGGGSVRVLRQPSKREE